MSLLYTLLVSWPLWMISAFLTYLLLVLFLTIAWHGCKTLLVRKVKFLHSIYMKPIEPSQAVLITGATSGIGLAVAKHLYAQGYSVIATHFGLMDVPGYDELKRLSEKGPSRRENGAQKLLLIELDVRQTKDIEKAYLMIEKWLNTNNLELYALINNAGLGSLQPFAWLQREHIFRLIDTNIIGYLLMTREFLPLLAKCKHGGRILLVSSGLGMVPGATYATYGMSKCAQIYLTKCLNLELKKKYRVQAVTVIPHNFIKYTSICSENVRTSELAWEELKPIERQLYKCEFDEHIACAKSLEAATCEHQAKIAAAAAAAAAASLGTAANKKQATLGKRPGRVDSKSLGWIEHASTMLKFLSDIVWSLKLGNISVTIEESGALECFEDALRLRNPPEHIFAGDPIYQLLVGSLLLVLPNYCVGLMGSTVTPSLYR